MNFVTPIIIGLVCFVITALFAMSGGVGFLLRPAMIFLGVPPQITIGTARTSAIPGSIIAQYILHKKKKIDWKLVSLLAGPNLLGGLMGVFIIVSLDASTMKRIIGVALIIAGIIFILNKKSGLKKSKPMLGKYHVVFSAPFLFITGGLLVIIGGVGPITRLLYIFGYGKTHIEAAALQKAINFWQTIVTTGFFIAFGLIDYAVMITLIIGSSLGNYVGTKFVLQKGEKYLRVLFIVVVFASAIKLLFFV